MRIFRWNSFTVIGVILLLIGFYGLIKGSGFEFDAGLPPKPLDGIYYLFVGILMLVNGYILPQPLPDEIDAGAVPVSAAKKKSE